MAIKTTFRLSMVWMVLLACPLYGEQPFFTEKFTNGFPVGWTTGDEPGNTKLWQHCSDFASCPPATFSYLFFKDERFESFSPDDGYVFLKAFESMSSTAPHSSYLRTETLNFASKSKVFLKFSTYLVAQKSDPATDAVVEVQVGNGAWVTFPIFHNLHHDVMQPQFAPPLIPFFPTFHPQVIYLDISALAAGQSDVKVQWRWDFDGNSEYFWAIDDVQFFDENPLHENAVWGIEPGQGDFDGGWNGWTTNTYPGDTCQWRWSASGLIYYPDNNTLANATGCSPTLLNGVALVNPTFCQNNNIGSLFTKTELTSPGIDLSAIPAGTRMAVQFHQSVRLADAEFSYLPITALAISTDGGQSYPDTVNVNPLLPFGKEECGMKTIGLPPAAAGSANLKVRFIFSGNSFYWIIDDVRILERFDNDLQVHRTFSAVAPDFSTPKDQVMPMHFLAEVENFGQSIQDFSTLFLTIYDDATSEAVHQDTISLGSLLPGTIVSDAIFDKTFTPPAKAANYSVFYRVRGDLPDEDTLNNIVRWKFAVTDTVFGKDRDFNAVNGYFLPLGDTRYEIGNCYFIPPNPGKQYASSVSFSFQGATQLEGEQLQIALYKWRTPDSFADADGDTLANVNEFEQIAITNYEVKMNDNRKLITVPLDPVDNTVFELEDSTYYFATVANLHPTVPFFIAGSEEIDYTATFWLSYQVGLPRFVSMLRVGDETDFRANAWALRRIPWVRLNLKNLTASHDRTADLPGLQIQPNPASALLYVNLENEKMQQQVAVEIFDLQGNLQVARNFTNVIVSQLPIDIEFLSNGFYFVRVTTEAGFAARKLAVFKK